LEFAAPYPIDFSDAASIPTPFRRGQRQAPTLVVHFYRLVEDPMKLREEFAAARSRWDVLTFYEKFEHAVVLILTGLIALVVVFAVWNLLIKVVASILSRGGFDPTDYEVFQAIFGMIFTVIIALEFKRSLLVVAERRHGIVQVRTVILIAMLAIVRKLLILDLAATDALHLLALSVAILVLGAVYWLVRDQDRREIARRRAPANR
jgi:uncharacterized membrane protein (DUF373 family)